MYLTMDEIILIGDTSKTRPDDAIVYIRDYDDQEVLTTDASVSQRTGPAVEYGRIYWDTQERACVVPHAWDKDHAAQAVAAFP